MSGITIRNDGLIRFEATDRGLCLRHLRKFYPNADVRDEPGNAKEVLDLAAADVIRIPDPDFHPNGAVMAGANATDDRWDEIYNTLKEMHDRYTSELEGSDE